MSTGGLAATDKDQKSMNRQEKSVISKGELVATEHHGCSENPDIPKGSEGSNPKNQIWPHHFSISPDYVPYMEKVFPIVRKICDWRPTDNLKDLDVNPAIWCIFMFVTLQAAVHLGRDYSLNLRSARNQSAKSVEQLFRTTEKLIKEQTEIAGLSTIDWDQTIESSLLCDRAVRILNSHTCVYSDSVLCLGGISPEPVQAWKGKIKWYLEEIQENSGNSETEGNDNDWSHNLQKSTNYVLHMEKVFSIVRQRYGLSPTDRMKDLHVNTDSYMENIHVCHSSSCSSSW